MSGQIVDAILWITGIVALIFAVGASMFLASEAYHAHQNRRRNHDHRGRRNGALTEQQAADALRVRSDIHATPQHPPIHGPDDT